MQTLTHHPIPHRQSSSLRTCPWLVLVSEKKKKQDGGEQNGGSPCNLKMTSFPEIVGVADR